MSYFTESELGRAEAVLNLAIMNLGGEAPTDVYTPEGYSVWLRSVVQHVASALTEERSAVERSRYQTWISALTEPDKS